MQILPVVSFGCRLPVLFPYLGKFMACPWKSNVYSRSRSLFKLYTSYSRGGRCHRTLGGCPRRAVINSKGRMDPVKVLITALIIMSVPAWASVSTCTTGTYASYQALSGGCSIGDATFTGFSGLGSISSSDLMVTPELTSTGAILTFTYVDSSGNSSPETVSYGQTFSLSVNYQVDVSGQLTGIETSSQYSSLSGGTETDSISGAGKSTSESNNGFSYYGVTTLNSPMVSTSASGIINISNTINLNSGSMGYVSQNEFINTLNYTSTQLDNDPDPGALGAPEVQSLSMIGSGLIALSIISRFWRKNRK
jgi:hypothetical protein